jgi:predicted small secreted protein
MKRYIFAALAALLVAFATTGCNTVRGAGEDVKSVGDTVSGNTP